MASSETDGNDRAVEGEEVERLRSTIEEEKQRAMRLLADYDNLRRRVARDEGTARQQGRRAALVPILPVVDTLERALATGSSDASFYEGVAATLRQLLTALAEAGAEPVETVGRPFDPNLHEIVTTVPADDVEPGTVVGELRRGWRLGDELLRPAQVAIAKADEGAESWR